jgi:hypothetical protein
MRTLILALPLLGFAVACSSESPSDERSSGTSSSGGGGGGSDAGLTEAGVDVNGGRDTLPASCFAACQNVAFTCQEKTASKTTVSEAELTLTNLGCEGTIKEGAGEAVAMKVDCGELKVCVGGAPGTSPTACVPGTFSAFTFGYTPAGGALTVCTRN